MTDSIQSPSMSQEINKVKLPAWWKTLLIILLAGSTCTAAVYFEKGLGAALVIVPFLSFSFWCDEANINWKNAPRLKAVLLVILLALSAVYLVGASQVSRIKHHKKPLIESGWMYDISVKVSRLV